MQVVWWWILFGITIAVYISLTGFFIPKNFFKAGYDFSFSNDRGLKNYKESGGRSIVYESKPEYRKYVSQYILSDRNNKKVIVCKLNKSISRLDYDIVVFGSDNKVFKVINTRENIETQGYTQAVELPPETAYISLVINFADNIRIDNGVKKIPKRKLMLFAGIVLFAAVAEIFCARLCLVNIYGDVFGEVFMASAGNTLTVLAIGLAVAIINLAAVIVYVRLKNKKQVRDEL